MKHVRPFRSALEQLAETFAHAIVEAVCEASVADIVDLADSRGEPPRHNGVVVAPRRRKLRTPRVPRKSVPLVVPEPEIRVGTEIDANALLESLEEQAKREAPTEPRIQIVPTRKKRERKALPPASADAPASFVPRTEVTLREGENLLLTSAGGAVIRRRRAS